MMDGRETSSCGGCGKPRTRVERWDGRAWDECHADGCGPELPRQRMQPVVVAWDAVAERRAALQRVGIHDFLVDDK